MSAVKLKGKITAHGMTSFVFLGSRRPLPRRTPCMQAVGSDQHARPRRLRRRVRRHVAAPPPPLRPIRRVTPDSDPLACTPPHPHDWPSRPRTHPPPPLSTRPNHPLVWARALSAWRRPRRISRTRSRTANGRRTRSSRPVSTPSSATRLTLASSGTASERRRHNVPRLARCS